MTNILITDDHPFYRMGLQAMLEADGHAVVGSVGDASGAMAAIAAEQPDIVLLDIRLPGMDGVALLKDLRSQGDQRPIIIVTVEVTDDQLLVLVEARVNGIVFKHEGEHRLLDAIETVKHGGRFIDGDLLERAMDLASGRAGVSVLDRLAEKEQAIAHYVADGLKNRDIAEKLATTEGTIKGHLHRIYAKCEVTNRAELASLVVKEAHHGSKSGSANRLT